MTKRKTPRLAYCEYVSPDSESSTEVPLARLQMIESVHRVFPEFLEGLSAGVFASYCELARAGYDFDQVLWSPRSSPYNALPDASGLKSALSTWAARFNAEADWLMDEALRTLRGWYVAPEWRKSLRWNPILGSSETVVAGERFKFEFAGWEPQLHSWLTYSGLLRKGLEEKLDVYEKETRKFAESSGLVPARRKYSTENFDWFVLYQFAGLTSGEIARGQQAQLP